MDVEEREVYPIVSETLDGDVESPRESPLKYRE